MTDLKESIVNTTILKNVSFEDIKTTLTFTSALGDIIKWQLIGLYIQNDPIEIERMESMFTKNAAFYEKRAYKTEAKTVYKMLKDNKEIQGKVYDLNDIANLALEDRPFSVGVAYKSRIQSEPKPVDNDLQAAKKAMEIHNLKEQGIPSALKLLELSKGNTVFAEQAKNLIEEAKIQSDREAILNKFPAITSDNIPDIKIAILNYMQELIALDQGEFESLYMEILAIHPQQDLQSQVA